MTSYYYQQLLPDASMEYKDCIRHDVAVKSGAIVEFRVKIIKPISVTPFLAPRLFLLEDIQTTVPLANNAQK